MPKGNNGGFTLVELLVVILIIVILSVTMLPLLAPFVTKAKYAAEGVPVIGNLRTKIEIYRIEKEHLPGIVLSKNAVPLATDGIAAAATAPTLENPTSTCLNFAGGDVDTDTVPATAAFYVQTLAEDPTLAGTEGDKYVPATLINGDYTIPASEFNYSADLLGLPYHAFTQIDVNFADLTGKNLRPKHFQYVGMGKGDTYMYALGCFGCADGLKAGTGYAVFEFNYPGMGRKVVMTYELYKPVVTTRQLVFVSDNIGTHDAATEDSTPALSVLPGATDTAGITAAKKTNAVYLPTWAQLTGLDADYQDALASMRVLGWQ